MSETKDRESPEEQTRVLRVLAGMIATDGLLEIDIENHADWPSNLSASAFVQHAAGDLDRLRYALRILHDDCVEYSQLNKLGGENNHVLKQARRALGLPENCPPQARHSEEPAQ